MELSYIEYLKELPANVILIFISLGLIILFYKIKNKSSPPGPWGLPLVGYWPYLRSIETHIDLQQLMKKYGEVYTFNITGQLYVHLGSIKSIKEAHLNNSECFTNRSSNFTFLNYIFDEGVVSANGESWRALRKFFVQAFRQYGLSSSKDVSGSMYDSVNTSMDKLRNANGMPVDITSVLVVHCSTILRRMFFNDDGITTEELQEVTEEYAKLTDVLLDKYGLLAGKVAKYFIFPFDARLKNSVKSYKKIYAIYEKILKRHRDTFDEQNIRNIIDNFYKERNDRKRKNDPTAKDFTDKALISSVIQFIGDGIVSVAASISCFVYALLQYPDEQEKIFKELEDVLGPNRQPSMEDKNSLPYTNAFIFEVIRTTDFFTLFPSLECTKETTINGCRIPEGAITLMNFWTAHRDPNVYEEPDVFKPSRFLKEAGKEKAELPVLFGVGKRSCIGETFTTMQMFLLLATLVKNFKLELPEGASNKSYLDMKIIAHPRMSK